MRHVERALGAQDQRILIVETSALPEFERTRSFYTHIGYIEEGRVRDYWASGDDLVIFRKHLQADNDEG